jgi:hypothetical protein
MAAASAAPGGLHTRVLRLHGAAAAAAGLPAQQGVVVGGQVRRVLASEGLKFSHPLYTIGNVTTMSVSTKAPYQAQLECYCFTQIKLGRRPRFTLLLQPYPEGRWTSARQCARRQPWCRPWAERAAQRRSARPLGPLVKVLRTVHSNGNRVIFLMEILF